MRGKSAQAAMEFLMTYGWAILVVLVVIGALAYFGVLSPSTLLPEKCSFPVSVSCSDHVIGTGSLGVILQNGAGRDMKVLGMTATSEALIGLCSTEGDSKVPIITDSCPVSSGLGLRGCTGGATFRNGESKTISMSDDTFDRCNFVETGRDKNRYNVTLFYTWLDSPGIVHQLPGELLARKP